MTDTLSETTGAVPTREEWAAVIERRIRISLHPEDRFPAGHPALDLLAEEIEEIHRIGPALAEKQLADFAMNRTGWMHLLGPIPSRRAERAAWERALPSDGPSGYYMNLMTERGLEKKLRRAAAERDWLTLLYVLTDPTDYWNNHRSASPDSPRNSGKEQLQEIRAAYEERIDDALEDCVESAVRAELSVLTGNEAWEQEKRRRLVLPVARTAGGPAPA
ncbi:hypothetical protein [Kitasatospora sp. NPDC092286]|uniref:hypothetical protein n=1 Tax=Kitasatospora sp. NPDC092286 TaxID=3364087 RepID=UPI0037FD4BE6